MIIDNFKTKDIILAAVLKLNNCEMVDIEKDGTKGTFVFREVPKNLVTDFDLGKVLVEPVTFNNSIKQLTTSVRRIN